MVVVVVAVVFVLIVVVVVVVVCCCYQRGCLLAVVMEPLTRICLRTMKTGTFNSKSLSDI